MTNEEVLKVLENEKECVQRQVNGNCDNKRDCVNCDLRLEDKEIILAYGIAISALEKQIPKKPYKVKEHKQNDYYCVVCKRYLGDEMELKYACLQPKYCENCGQALDFNSNGSDTE